MEAVFMDSSFNTTRVLDNFNSFIWNDRYCGYGDFEIRLPMDFSTLNGIKEGYYVSIRESDRYMIVDRINISTSLEEGNWVIVSGRSLESILERRIVYEDMTLTGNLQNSILRLLNTNVIHPINEKRKIPELSFISNNDTSVSSLQISSNVSAGENLYDVIYDICNINHLGFKILPEKNGAMYFTLYSGIDRTYNQNKKPWVVFSPKFENLKTSEMDINTEDLKNCIITRSEYTEMENNEEIEKRIEVQVGDEFASFERREVFKTSREIPEKIDEEAFGKAEDRVDRRKYETWELLYFNSGAYHEAMIKAGNTYANSRREIPKTHTEYKTKWLSPGDPGYIPEMSGVGQSTIVQVVVQGATPEEAAEIQRRNDAIWESLEPNRRDYEVWGWALTDQQGYDKALSEAQAKIDAEIAAAKQNALNTTKDIMRGDAEKELSKYLTISSFEGELDPLVQYTYGKDYELGDLVQIVNEFDFQAATRVVSMMFSQEEGIGFIARPSFESDDKAVFEV